MRSSWRRIISHTDNNYAELLYACVRLHVLLAVMGTLISSNCHIMRTRCLLRDNHPSNEEFDYYIFG